MNVEMLRPDAIDYYIICRGLLIHSHIMGGRAAVDVELKLKFRIKIPTIKAFNRAPENKIKKLNFFL